MMLLSILTLLFVPINTAPLHKRIAQVIADSTARWEEACNAAGGGQQCNTLSVVASSTLLALAGNCDQQNVADDMIDLAKMLNNDPMMIRLTQIFVQQPRDTSNSLAVPYCDIAPRNPELKGLFQCQFQGTNQAYFVGGLQIGEPSTIPFDLSSPVSPPGSCPANPLGPIEDGMQLIDLTQDPGVGTPALSVPAEPVLPAASITPSESPAINATSVSTSSPSTPSSDFFSSSSSSEVAKWATGVCMFIVLLLRGRTGPSSKSGVSADEALEAAANIIETGEPLLAQSNSSSPSPSNTLARPSAPSSDSFSIPSSSVSPNGLGHPTFRPEFIPPSTTPSITMVFTQCANTYVSLGSRTMGEAHNWDQAAAVV